MAGSLDLWAVQWLLPRELTFSRVILEPRLSFMVEAYGGYLRRMKGVFRAGSRALLAGAERRRMGSGARTAPFGATAASNWS